MNTTDKIAIAALILSGVGFFYTVYLNIKQRTYIETQHELNKIALAKEYEQSRKKEYAEITAKMYKVDSEHWKIKIANIGEGIARNLSCSFIGEQKWEILNFDLFPLSTLDSRSSIELKPLIYIGSPDKCTIVVNWEDVREKNEKSFLLTL